ncbi:MAG TPA: DUF4419 domain-containing protein [Nitrospira sp.]|nr:DUF4419 domain-containing protein [Nitrospira sp.]
MKRIPSSVKDHAPILHRSAIEICFRVDEVEVSYQPCTLTKTCTRVRQDIGRPLLACSHDESSEVILEAGAATHGLVNAVYVAFSQHRPLVLTPDAIWITLAQGFAHHITNHAEALRSSVVRHKGTMTLQAETVELQASQHWAEAVQQWSNGIRQHIQGDLYQLMICDFSTTSPVIRTASQVVMMDAFQQYFDYQLSCICGIPAIAVKGSVDDWVRIRERIDVMATFHLDWWTDRLKPICDGFIATVQGTPSQQFWKHIYSPKEVYGGDLITGWVADLFPYLTHPVTNAPTIRNPILAIPREKLTEEDGISSAKVPTGLSRAPFVLKSASADDSKELEIVAGFLGVTQHADSGRLEPEIGWAVVEPDAFTQVLNKFARAGASDATSKSLMTDSQDHRLTELLEVGIPRELVQLMDRFAEGQVFYEQTPHSWTLKPATAITARSIGGADSSMAVHFMDLADGRIVAYTTVRAKDGWGREGRVLVGQLDGITIQADHARVIAKGLTEFLDWIVREEGSYYFDEPSFESGQLS